MYVIICMIYRRGAGYVLRVVGCVLRVVGYSMLDSGCSMQTVDYCWFAFVFISLVNY